MGDGGSDTDSSNARGSFRTSLTSRGFANAAPAQLWSILNSTPVECNGLSTDSVSHPGLLGLASFQAAALDSVTAYRWHDDSALLVEPLVAWGAPAIDSPAKIRGQLWDSFIATESYPADITTVVDSHNYYNITNNNGGTATLPASMRGSVFVVVP
jgi:hypothetical protein